MGRQLKSSLHDMWRTFPARRWRYIATGVPWKEASQPGSRTVNEKSGRPFPIHRSLFHVTPEHMLPRNFTLAGPSRSGYPSYGSGLPLHDVRGFLHCRVSRNLLWGRASANTLGPVWTQRDSNPSLPRYFTQAKLPFQPLSFQFETTLAHASRHQVLATTETHHRIMPSEFHQDHMQSELFFVSSQSLETIDITTKTKTQIAPAISPDIRSSTGSSATG